MTTSKLFRTIPIIILIAVSLAGCEKKSTNPPVSPTLLERLQSLPNCSVVEIDPPEGAHYSRAFQITITQPVDHANPGGQSFEQRLYLSHIDESAPMVLATWDYDVTGSTSMSLRNCYRPTSCWRRTGTTGITGPTRWQYPSKQNKNWCDLSREHPEWNKPNILLRAGISCAAE